MIYQQIYDFLMSSVFGGVSSPPIEWVEMLSTCLATSVVLVPIACVIGIISWLLKLFMGR